MAVTIFEGFGITVAGSGCCVAGTLALAFALFVLLIAFALIGWCSFPLQLLIFCFESFGFSFQGRVGSSSHQIRSDSGRGQLRMPQIGYVHDKVGSQLVICGLSGVWEIEVKRFDNLHNDGMSRHRVPKDIKLIGFADRVSGRCAHVEQIRQVRDVGV